MLTLCFGRVSSVGSWGIGFTGVCIGGCGIILEVVGVLIGL